MEPKLTDKAVDDIVKAILSGQPVIANVNLSGAHLYSDPKAPVIMANAKLLNCNVTGAGLTIYGKGNVIDKSYLVMEKGIDLKETEDSIFTENFVEMPIKPQEDEVADQASLW